MKHFLVIDSGELSETDLTALRSWAHGVKGWGLVRLVSDRDRSPNGCLTDHIVPVDLSASDAIEVAVSRIRARGLDVVAGYSSGAFGGQLISRLLSKQSSGCIVQFA